MRWKDFLYYSKVEKAAVITLLILILSTLIINVVLMNRNQRDIIVSYDDSLARLMDEFMQELQYYGYDDIAPNLNYKADAGQGRETNRQPPAGYAFSRNQPERSLRYPKMEKFAAGETISLNETDTTEWKKVPGIGSVFASRIVKYRNLLGGFVSIEQLREVYGIDNERYSQLSPYIREEGDVVKLDINRLEFKELLRHPYLSYQQVQAIMNLRKKKGDLLSIDELVILDEFTTDDLIRLRPYLKF